eukprot:961423-Pleurochrysis_carterae.AAC.2
MADAGLSELRIRKIEPTRSKMEEADLVTEETDGAATSVGTSERGRGGAGLDVAGVMGVPPTPLCTLCLPACWLVATLATGTAPVWWSLSWCTGALAVSAGYEWSVLEPVPWDAAAVVVAPSARKGDGSRL